MLPVRISNFPGGIFSGWTFCCFVFMLFFQDRYFLEYEEIAPPPLFTKKLLKEGEREFIRMDFLVKFNWRNFVWIKFFRVAIFSRIFYPVGFLSGYDFSRMGFFSEWFFSSEFFGPVFQREFNMKVYFQVKFFPLGFFYWGLQRGHSRYFFLALVFPNVQKMVSYPQDFYAWF